MYRVLCLVIGILFGGEWTGNGIFYASWGQSPWLTQTGNEGANDSANIKQAVKRLQALGVRVNSEGTKINFLPRYETEFHVSEYGWKKIDPNERRVTSTAIPLIAQLTDIVLLNFAECKSLDDQKLSQLPLHEFVQLRGLYLYHTSVGDGSLDKIGELNELVELSLSYTRITDKELGKLNGLHYLRKLDLCGTQIGDAGMENLSIFKHQQIRIAILGETQITSKGALQLSQLPTMEWLDLSWSKVDDRIMPMCSEFKALEILNLNGTGITDVGLQDLASGQAAEHLEHLELSDTKITDKSVETLSNFRQLKHLTISGSLMTSADVEKLSELCRNCELLPTDW